MALRTNEQYSSYSEDDRPPIHASRIIEAKAASGAGTEVHAVGTLMAFNTANENWEPWDPAGSNGVDTAKGVLYPEAYTPDDTDEQIVHVMIGGTIRLGDLLAGDGVTASAAQIKAAVAATFRELGIVVQNHNSIR